MGVCRLGQEGMLVLYEIIKSHPNLLEDHPRLYRYFKTKFRNRIHDLIRRQESQKRKLDRQPYRGQRDRSSFKNERAVSG